MFNYKNPTLQEKPNHAHYPACLGRLETIRKQGTAFFIYSLISSLVLALMSLTAAPLQVVGWLPLLFGGSRTYLNEGLSFLQMFLCLGLGVLGFFGCTRRKVLHVILFVIYVLMFIAPIFYMFTLLDALTFIAGGLGVIYGYRAPASYLDYRQLSETEGFPVFSIILAESDEKKKRMDSFDNWYEQKKNEKRSYDSSGKDLTVNVPVPPSVPQTAPPVQPAVKKEVSAEMGNMPEIVINRKVSAAADPDRFKPKTGKAGRISDSGLKFR